MLKLTKHAIKLNHIVKKQNKKHV